jgi:hypothetical protein
MGKEVKYSWLSAKRNPEMIKDFFLKKLKELKNSVDYEERIINDLSLKFNAKQFNTGVTAINTDGEIMRTIKVKLKDIVIETGYHVNYTLVETGYLVLINLLDKYKSKLEHCNSCKKSLEKVQGEYDYFMRRYYGH